MQTMITMKQPIFSYAPIHSGRVLQIQDDNETKDFLTLSWNEELQQLNHNN